MTVIAVGCYSASNVTNITGLTTWSCDLLYYM